MRDTPRRIQIEITDVCLLSGEGTDKLMFTTTLPEGQWPYKEFGETFQINVAKGNGLSYLKLHFPSIRKCRIVLTSAAALSAAGAVAEQVLEW